ncbi:MAG: EamA family transporter [Sulfitobacter sp.]|nr:MAG: EamA family transporter [Sulfitobacter sp.]
MTLKEWILLSVLSVLWGGAFFFASVAVKVIPPLTLVFLRVGIAALVLLIFLKAKKEAIPKGKNIWSSFFFMGLLNNLVPFSLLFWAQTSISGGLASILNSTTPMFSILVAHFLLSDEKMALNKVIGVLFGILGVGVLVGGNAMLGMDGAIFGIIACLGAALSYGFAGVYGRRFKAQKIVPSVGAFGQLAATTIMIIPIIIVIDKPWLLPLPGTSIILSVVSLAVFSTAFAYLIFFKLLATAGAVNVGLVTLLIPVSAIFLGATFLNEQLEMQHYVGVSLILLGLVAVDGRIASKAKSLSAE